MSADREFTGFRCYCAHCLGQGEDASASAKRSYYVPDPPGIPLPPGSNTTPEVADPGFKGPRHLTLLRGDDWNDPQVGTSVLIPYTFATRAMSNYGTATLAGGSGFEYTSGEPVDAVQRASIREALALWEQVSGVTFIEVPDTAAWNFPGIRFLMEGLEYIVGDASVFDIYGITLPPTGDTYGFNVVLNRLHYADDPLTRGTGGFWTALHEIGHAIGLKHPFGDGLVLSTSEDNNKNTVMSYTDKGNLANLGPFDVTAVQYLYGTPAAAAAASVRWARGVDGSLVTTGDQTANNITGLDIRDVVLSHAGGDLIRTHGGDDLVVAGAGDDAVFGGTGVDTLQIGSLRRQVTVAIGDNKGTVAGPDGMDTYYEVEVLRFVDGDVALSQQSAAAQAYRLYAAAFGRAPDPTGLGHWAGALQSGATSLSDAASGFYHSAEFAARYGAPDAVGYVTQLYANVLGRAPDAAGVRFWADAVLNPAVAHSGVLVGFSESAENQRKTTAAIAKGLWIVNPEAADVMRAYFGVLDRLPDANGLANWTAARDAGMGQAELVNLLVSSAEFQDRFGGLSNRDFVEQFYRTSLGREADVGGLAAWTHVLDAGLDSRAGVALAFANSPEMTAKVTPWIADGLHFV